MIYYKVTCLPIVSMRNKGTAIYKSEDGETCYFVRHVGGDDPGDWSGMFKKSACETSSYTLITELSKQEAFLEVL